jgi:hypothetical protein
MRTTTKKLTVAVGAILTVALLTLTAGAQCSNVGLDKPTVKPQAWQQGSEYGQPKLQLVDAATNDPIVGLWHFTFTVGDNIIDHGFATWHQDGTEITNSGRVPATGNFCMGVWQLQGVHYKLNHYAIGWDESGNLIGVGNIKEDVVLNAAGTAFNGTFSITQYDTSGNVLATVSGNVHADRIGINSTIKTL